MGGKRGWEPDRWRFSVEEVSPGVYRAEADDQQGGVLHRVRYDPDEALALVKRDAAELTERRRAAGSKK